MVCSLYLSPGPRAKNTSSNSSERAVNSTGAAFATAHKNRAAIAAKALIRILSKALKYT